MFLNMSKTIKYENVSLFEIYEFDTLERYNLE